MSELNTLYLAGLVIRAKANDSNAFAELYALTYNRVYNYARHYLRDDFLAQDALQEIYILALKNLQKLNDPSLFIAWIKRIAFNVCYDMSNKLKLTSNQVNDLELLELVRDEHIDSNPETSIQQKDEVSRLKEALNELPFNEKQVLIMRYFNEMKLQDIAAAMEISHSSVKRYIASGQERLRTMMKG